MSSARLNKVRDSLPNIVMPESKAERRVSLTGFSNVVLDVSTNKTPNDEDKDKLRVRFAEVSSMDLAMSGSSQKPTKRKYSVALQTLKPFRPSSKDGKLPMNKVGLFSYTFLTWFSGFVWKMFKNRANPINEDDVWECSDAEGLSTNTERLQRLWKEELGKNGEKKASFLKVWMRFCFTRVFVSLLLLSINAIVTFSSSALLVNKVVAYLESPDDDLWYGLGLCLAIFSCEVIRAVTFANMIVFSCQTGTRFRSGVMGIMYNKLLRMRSIKGKTNSEIINVFGVDSYRIYIATWTTGFLLSLPLYVIIGTVYCYILIGYWCFVSVGTFTVCYFAQTFLTRFIAAVRAKCVQYTDLRVRRMGEVLNSMKFIKMYAWEKPFTDAIKDVRKFEQKYVLRGTILNGIITSIIPITPTIASVVTISVYTAAGNDLTASTAFAVIGTMNFLRIIVALLPFALRSYAEAKVSFRRIQTLLLTEEHEKPTDEVFDKDNAVEVKAASFVWETMPDSSTKVDMKKIENGLKKRRKSSIASLADSRRASISNFALTDINLDVKKGKLIGICGSVGSGKSSLMYAILGRMMQQKGHIAVAGEVAYVSQQAWIFNATLKENILFGREYDKNRYQDAINCCGLEPDIQILTDGDETEIGERGTNLSGGQKQRVNLARAVYSDSDIFILDDPMSALDVKVGRQIFHSCIKGALQGKTILLVTHQLQYLKHCDEVVVMEDGIIEEKGLHHELIANDGIYANMFRIFDNTTMKPINKKGTTKEADTKITTTQKEKSPSTSSQQNGDSKTGALKKGKKQKLVLAEEASIGNVTFGTYSAYISAAGGWFLIIGVILVYFISAGSLVFTDWWLSQWLTVLNSPSNSPNITLEYRENTTASIITTILSSNSTSINSLSGDDMNSSWLYDINNDTYLYVYIGCIAGIIILEITKSVTGAFVSMLMVLFYSCQNIYMYL
ncbi:Multidrug resistance-associated protein 5 [Mactra antiquata]